MAVAVKMVEEVVELAVMVAETSHHSNHRSYNLIELIGYMTKSAGPLSTSPGRIG